jgi:hypothetical protein
LLAQGLNVEVMVPTREKNPSVPEAPLTVVPSLFVTVTVAPATQGTPWALA